VRRLVALAGCVALVLGAGSTPAAAYGGHAWVATRAVQWNVMDGSDLARGAFDLRVTRAAEVTASNLALARNRCDDCRTVSVAFQVLLAGHGPTDVFLSNDSAAVNERCSGCDALALAYQFVVVSRSDLGLSPEGLRELASAQADLRTLLDRAPPDAVIEAEVAAIATRVRLLLTDELRTGPVVRTHVERRTPPQRPAGLDRPAAPQRPAEAPSPLPEQRPIDADRPVPQLPFPDPRVLLRP
jgi:hypothetical protein